MKYCSGAPIGKVGPTSYPNSVEVVSRNPIPIGTYVSIPFRSFDIYLGKAVECYAIGVVSLTSYKRMLPVSPTATASESIGVEDEMLRYALSMVRVIALICTGEEGVSVRVPNVPPPPDSEVYLASTEALSTLFSCRKEGSVRIGHLLSKPEVEVYVDLNALTRHLFITGTTNSGKSNTVAVLADRIASYGGTVIIFDVHGEYSSLSVEGDAKLVSIEYRINPLDVPAKVLARMIVPEASATVQRMLVSKALSLAQKLFRELINDQGLGEKALENVTARLQLVLRQSQQQLNQDSVKEALSMVDDDGGADINTKLAYVFKEVVKSLMPKPSDKDRKDSYFKACAKVDEFFENVNVGFDTPNIGSLLSPSTIIVLNASLLGDEQKDYVLKVVLDELLWLAKRNYHVGRPLPTVVFIEEAHRFLATDRSTVSKHSIERIAREGRKFGLALGIVSQRPRNIDVNTLSQVQNFVFMKLVQEADQQAVMNASDMLTEDLARALSSMATGEALLIGDWIGRFPVFVKVDRHRGKRLGATLDISSIWRSYKLNASVLGERLSMVSEAARDFEKLFG